MKGTPSLRSGALRASWAPGLVAVCGACFGALERIALGWYCNTSWCENLGKQMAPAFSLPENVLGCTLPGPV